MPSATMTADLASRFATLALGHVTREYPNKLDHVLSASDDVQEPRHLHPIFYGSFDWHSCVHGYWLLTRIYRRFPDLPVATRIRELLDRQITPSNVAGELAYLRQALRGTFERPYGWAWLLMLAGELARHTSHEGQRWSARIGPLALAFSQRFLEFLPKATYPVRAGTHFNTAFALTLGFEYAHRTGSDDFAAMLRKKARAWYGGDTDCQAWEPGGDDFLSPALTEAECMRRALPAAEFEGWFARFLPRVDVGEPETLFQPPTITDRTDGKIAHLDGVNLTRAWCWRSLARSWPADDPRRVIALEAAEQHLLASLPHIAGDYMGEHWLATFALLALEAEPRIRATLVE